MDYKEKYEAMVQRARELHEAGNFLTKKQMEIVCPELAESEDERIRKEIINYLDFSESHNLLRASDYKKKKGWIAYLEKQKEQKPRLIGEDSVEKMARQMYETGQTIEEQKPVEWSEEDEITFKCIKSILKDYMSANYKGSKYCTNEQVKKWIKWFDTVFHSLSPQPKVEWSEKDERNIRNLESILYYDKKLPEEIRVELGDFLKSLPERFNLQPKQEWSEEDEEKLNHIIQIVHIAHGREVSVEEKEELEKFLKFLRPQQKKERSDYVTPHKEFFKWIYDRLINIHKENPNADYMLSFKKRIEELSFDESHWKPSEEQMKVLKLASMNKYLSARQLDILVSLYEQLKKLM